MAHRLVRADTGAVIDTVSDKYQPVSTVAVWQGIRRPDLAHLELYARIRRIFELELDREYIENN